jgi:hypothetical protein
MGFAKGVHGHPRAVLYLDAREPKHKDEWIQYRRSKTIELRAVSIEATRSEWVLVDPDAHDFDWLRKHAKTIEVFVPITCPRRKPREG